MKEKMMENKLYQTLNENEKLVADNSLFWGGKYKCPRCNKNEVRCLMQKGWGFRTRTVIFPRKLLNARKYYCFNYKASFSNIKTLAIVNGIFLDRNTDLKERTLRYISEICKELSLSDAVKSKSIEILNMYNKCWGFRSVASASVYFSALLCNEKKTQREVSSAANITEVTLRERYQNIIKKLNIDVGEQQ